jgi:pimeloyl-ACP methyl ester carboxylesterase
LLSRSIDLETHIADILGLMKWERLANVTLVAHSYGGIVATGVADRSGDRVGSLIYLDAFVPKDGQSLLDLLPPQVAEGMRRYASEHGEGFYLPREAAPPRPEGLVEPEISALLDSLNVAQPLATLTQRLRLSGANLETPKKVFIHATASSPNFFGGFAAEARALGWPVEVLHTHHFPMLSTPTETADLLARYAA